MSDSRTGIKKRKVKRSVSILVRAAYVLVLCALIYNLVQVYVDYREDRREANQIAANVEIQKEKNRENQAMLDNFDKDSYAAKVAHDVLGCAFPDERLYYDKQLADN